MPCSARLAHGSKIDVILMNKFCIATYPTRRNILQPLEAILPIIVTQGRKAPLNETDTVFLIHCMISSVDLDKSEQSKMCVLRID